MEKDLTIKEYQIADNFWCFEQSGVRSFLFTGTEQAIAVDALHGGDLLSHIRKITDNPVKLILTHSDQDHTGCAYQFDRAYLHPSEFSRFSEKYEKQIPLCPIREGEIEDIGSFRFEVLLLPGHTPGSIALLERGKRFIISGDTVQTGPIYMFGNGRSMSAYNHSLRYLKQYESEADLFYSSHHKLTVPYSAVDQLIDLSLHVLSGNYPDPLPAPDYLPADISIFSDGNVSFLLPNR
ncbi:MAG: MBL fold metallo-hydrolase [Eubacteriales bacterium]|nr:MBL fold metallo-hydrolase [Eubacteriales bacterium]